MGYTPLCIEQDQKLGEPLAEAGVSQRWSIARTVPLNGPRMSILSGCGSSAEVLGLNMPCIDRTHRGLLPNIVRDGLVGVVRAAKR